MTSWKGQPSLADLDYQEIGRNTTMRRRRRGRREDRIRRAAEAQRREGEGENEHRGGHAGKRKRQIIIS